MEMVIEGVIRNYLDNNAFFKLVICRALIRHNRERVLRMWLNEMVSKNLFIESVKNQTAELEVARKRNAELQKKCQHLEWEQNKLNDLVQSNQVDIITKKNNLNALLEDLKNQKRSNLTVAQRLEICKEQIGMIQEIIEQTNHVMSHSITELKPMRETLSFKWDVVECLQEKLLETRLQAAEKEAIITELKQREKDLINEIELLKTERKETLPVSQLQEQFLTARIREADVVLEFDKLKRTLAIIKHDLEEEKKMAAELENNRDGEDSFHISFGLRDRYHEQLKSQEESSIANTVDLQNEIDYLKMQIKKLEEIKQDITGRVYFNEEVKVHLHEVKTSILLRLQKTNQKLENAIKRNTKLEENITKDLSEIQDNVNDKDIKIAQLAQEIKNLQLQNEKCAKSNDESMASMNEDAVNSLQEEINYLEEKITKLSRLYKNNLQRY